MPSRLTATFDALRKARRPGLVTYTTAADPDIPRSADILRALDRAGADVLEVGVPFSDPLADGPVIQRATERALAAGGTLRATLEIIRNVRSDVQAPIVVFSYANPLLRMGTAEFARQASAAGVDGVLALDLPIEEAGAFQTTMDSAGLDEWHKLGERLFCRLGVGVRGKCCTFAIAGDEIPAAKRLVEN